MFETIFASFAAFTIGLFAFAKNPIKEFHWFDLHPWFMTVAMLSSLWAVRSMLPADTSNSADNKEKKIASGIAQRVKNHRLLQWIAVSALSLGLAVVEYSKFSQDKYHFTSWHGLVSITACILMISLAPMASVFRDYPRYIPSMVPGGIKGYWKIHRFYGMLVMLVFSGAYVLGWETAYMQRIWVKLIGGELYWKTAGWIMLSVLTQLLTKQVFERTKK